MLRLDTSIRDTIFVPLVIIALCFEFFRYYVSKIMFGPNTSQDKKKLLDPIRERSEDLTDKTLGNILSELEDEKKYA